MYCIVSNRQSTVSILERLYRIIQLYSIIQYRFDDTGMLVRFLEWMEWFLERFERYSIDTVSIQYRYWVLYCTGAVPTYRCSRIHRYGIDVSIQWYSIDTVSVLYLVYIRWGLARSKIYLSAIICKQRMNNVTISVSALLDVFHSLQPGILNY